MKKTIALLFILFALQLNAQQKPWEKLKMDSVQFSEAYGTEFQYNYQKDISDKSSHKMLKLFTGANYLYLYDLALYLGYNGYNVSWSEGDDDVVIKATPKIITSSNKNGIKVTGKLNKFFQITSVTINGPADDLIKLYVYYWELTPITLYQLKSKKQVNKEFVSDLVTIKWITTNPVITVKKNPHAIMDLFKFKK